MYKYTNSLTTIFRKCKLDVMFDQNSHFRVDKDAFKMLIIIKCIRRFTSLCPCKQILKCRRCMQKSKYSIPVDGNAEE